MRTLRINQALARQHVQIPAAKTAAREGSNGGEDLLFCHFFFGYEGRAAGVPNFEEYYDHRTDPGEHRNLASASDSAAVLETLRAQLPATCADPVPEISGKCRPSRG